MHQFRASIPSYDIAREIGDLVTAEEERLALWDLLYHDPLYELRSYAATAQEGATELAPHELPPWQQLQERLVLRPD